jgi:RNA polymerase sigma-70 factor (ECF subfamily)
MGNVRVDTEETMMGRWLDQYGDRFYSYARSRLRDDEEVQDVLQDTFLAALVSIKNFRGESRESTYLFSILRNKIHDVYRMRVRDHRFIDSGSNDTGADLENAVRDPSPGPDHLAEAGELRSALEECIRGLPEIQSLAFTLREMDHLSTEEICKILDVSVTNLNVILYRARMRMRRCITEKGILHA